MNLTGIMDEDSKNLSLREFYLDFTSITGKASKGNDIITSKERLYIYD